MRAINLTAAIGPDGLRAVDVDEPDDDGRVVVDMCTWGVSYPDLLQTAGAYQVMRPLPFVPGIEGAGFVRSAPSGAGFSPGDRVAVLALSGAWQQTVAVLPNHVFPLPDSVSLTAGSGILMNYMTAHFALVDRAQCNAGETVLVHGAGGGLGTAALQVAAAFGLDTIAVVSSDAKAHAARENRATHVIGVDGWKDRVGAITGGRGVDIVIDPVGGDRFTDSIRSLRRGGRLVVLGFVGGEIPTVKVNRLLLKNVSVLGAGWGEYVREVPEYPATQWAHLEPLLASGELQIVEPTLVPFEDAATALRMIESRSAIGKVALHISN
ncbi:NADPH:quinone oxidoreductase family protein [Prescottella equi]|uniref:NADPH:quinone oxidoreductase family protein n=1 Tax=Rhodococcus hoagii TaxID=43767 RepID=UPI000A1158C8|nr:NADPH:quinone oxidoreductase family protein [Prescottella equi]ORL16038.1 NADPH:quinone oxidoreductase [Prescottella equi]